MKSERLLGKLSRVTTSGKFISEIDGLRFIAIGTVIFFHIARSAIFANSQDVMPNGRWLVSIVEQGFHGVELFFIISGFILALPFASHHLKNRSKVNLKQYFVRRLTRLEPPYMLCMVLFFGVLVLLKGKAFEEQFSHLLASLAYVHNIVFSAESTINDVAWSLEIEIQFYILVPLLSMMFLIKNKSWRRAFIGAICLLSMTHQWLFIERGGFLYLSIFRFIHFFLIGFLIADIYLEEWNEKPTQRLSWDIVSLVGWPLLFLIWYVGNPTASPGVLNKGIESFLFPSLSLILYIAVFRGKISNWIMTNPWITTIGGMCYTIYLLHNYLIGYVVRFTKGFVPTENYALNFLVQAVIIVPPVLIVCALYFALIEKPCMRKDWPQKAYARIQSIFTQSTRMAKAKPLPNDADTTPIVKDAN